MTDTETRLQLDRKHVAVISGARIAIQRLQSDGKYDAVAFMQGGGRTILRWCEDNNVSPTREAEQILGALPDIGFRDRG